MQENFYQNKYFDQLSDQITDLKSSMTAMEDKIDAIQTKVIYMYGFAAAIGLVFSFVIDWARVHIFGS